MIHEIDHIAQLRAHTPWYTTAAGGASSLFGTGGENLIHSLVSSRRSGDSGSTLIERVDHSLSENMKFISRLRVKAVGNEQAVSSLIADEPKGQKDINIAAMGEGTSQSLLILAGVLAMTEGECLAIEQPELHFVALNICIGHFQHVPIDCHPWDWLSRWTGAGVAFELLCQTRILVRNKKMYPPAARLVRPCCRDIDLERCQSLLVS